MSKTWLRNLWGRRAGDAAAAYRARLDPGDPSARLVLADLAHYCNAGRTSFVAGDPHQTAFNEGARDVFLHVAGMLAMDERQVADLFEERRSAITREKENDDG